MDNISMDKITGTYAAFFASNKAAWHKKGSVVLDCLSWEDAYKLAQMNWEVTLNQLKNPITGELIDHYCTIRNDTNEVLGVMKKGYSVIQNNEAFLYTDALIESMNGMHYESAGVLGRGERIWCLAKVPKIIDVAGIGDMHETYLLFTTSHDGSLAATCKLTTVRVVCQNTLTQALKGAGAFTKIKHTGNATDRLNQAKRLMTGVISDIDKLTDKLNELALRKVSPESFKNTMIQLFGNWEDKASENKSIARIESKISSIKDLFISNDKNAFPQIEHSAYSLLNSVIEYQDHFSPVRQTQSKINYTEDQLRADACLFGNAADLKEKALDIILETTVNDSRQVISRPVYFNSMLQGTQIATQIIKDANPTLDDIINSTLRDA